MHKDGSQHYPIDSDCDGQIDVFYVVPDIDSEAVYLMGDTTGDGIIDTMVFDQGRDGAWDYSLYDTDGDGNPDLRGYHPDGDPEATSFEKYTG